MNITAAKKEIQMAIKTGWPVLLIGQPGIGKTDLCQQIAEDNGMDFISEIATMSEPTDIKGLPSIINNKAEFLPYGFLRKLIEAESPTLVLIDDLGHATIEVQKAYMHLLLARKVNDHKISELIYFITATNDVGQRAGVTGIISPLQNRLYQIRVEPDSNEWCQWAIKKDVDPLIIGFIRSNPNIFNDWRPPIGIEATITPRSTKMLADFYKKGANSLNSFSGCVGQAVAIQFMSYVQIFKELPTINEIIKNPEKVKVPKEIDRKYGICAALAYSDIEEKIWKNILIYLEKFPMEFQVSCISDASNRRPELLKLPSVRNWIKQHQQILL